MSIVQQWCDCDSCIAFREANKTPPMGIMPRRLWDESRTLDLLEAMRRYVEAGKKVPVDWLNELHDLLWHVEDCKP